MPDAVFTMGPGGAEAVSAYSRAADDDQALPMLREAAVMSLGRAAQRQDGSLDHSRLGMWQRRYQDALREVPEFGLKAGRVGEAETAVGQASKDAAAALRQAEADARTGVRQAERTGADAVGQFERDAAAGEKAATRQDDRFLQEAAGEGKQR